MGLQVVWIVPGLLRLLSGGAVPDVWRGGGGGYSGREGCSDSIEVDCVGVEASGRIEERGWSSKGGGCRDVLVVVDLGFVVSEFAHR